VWGLYSRSQVLTVLAFNVPGPDAVTLTRGRLATLGLVHFGFWFLRLLHNVLRCAITSLSRRPAARLIPGCRVCSRVDRAHLRVGSLATVLPGEAAGALSDDGRGAVCAASAAGLARAGAAGTRLWE
jgi:hypothetical protein